MGRIVGLLAAVMLCVCLNTGAARADTFTNTFPIGWSLAAFPAAPPGGDLCAFLQLQAPDSIAYSWENGLYRSCGDGAIAFVPNRAYWIYFPSETTISYTGEAVPAAQEITLRPGWNLVGTSALQLVGWDDDVQVSGETLAASGRILNKLLAFKPEKGDYSLSTLMNPWQGYMVFAREECTLRLPQQAARAYVSGMVVDDENQPVAGAAVRATGEGRVAVTDALGQFAMPVADISAEGAPLRLSASKGGYIETFHTVRVSTDSVVNGVQSATLRLTRAPGASDATSAEIVLADGVREAVARTADGATVNVTEDMAEVTFSAPGEAGAPPAVQLRLGSADGSGASPAAVLGTTGPVSGEIIYGDPTNPEDLEFFPGEFLTSSDTGNGAGGEGVLVTAGFARITLTDAAGRPITKFAPGTAAEVTMRVPRDSVNPETGFAVKPGDTIPVFVFDESTGEWIVEHNADGSVKRTTVENDNDGNLFVKFTTTHLTWFNLDWKGQRCPDGSPTVTFVDKYGNLVTNVTMQTKTEGWRDYPRFVPDGVAEFRNAPADITWQVWAEKDGQTSEVGTINACQDVTLIIGEKEPDCFTNAQCEEGNPFSYDRCMRPGQKTATCIHIPCESVCSSDLQCDDGKPLSTDTCINGGACQSFCRHVNCNAACSTDEECGDGIPGTADVCRNPGTCEAACENPVCESVCTSHADCNDGNPDTTEKCENGGTCGAACKVYESFCTLKVNKVNYVPGEAMTITFTASNDGPDPVLCGAEVALKRGQKPPTWNSFDENLYITIPPYSRGVIKSIKKVIPDTWVGTDTNLGSDYDIYTVHDTGEWWAKGDNFNIHVKWPCEIACTTSGACADDNPLTTDVCVNPGTCEATCSHQECPVACASAADCSDENNLTYDVCYNPGTCLASCKNPTCKPSCTADTQCSDGNARTRDVCESPNTCEAKCVNPVCTPRCINDAGCSDGNALTRDVCLNPDTCEASCENPTCTPACANNDICNDNNPGTTDTCIAANTCDAHCVNTTCTPLCENDAACNDNNSLTTDTCTNPGTCAATCENIACTSECASDSQCDDYINTTLDYCRNANTCSAHCENCTPRCKADSECNDNNALTVDTCLSPNTCEATCQSTACTPACTADTDCNDGNPDTDDACLIPNTCHSVCGVRSDGQNLAVGEYHTCGLLPNGNVKCWGLNTRGVLGDGTNINSAIPVNVAGITNAVSIDGRYEHMCALLSTGSVKCWGLNRYGQLGNGTTNNSNVPVEVPGITNAVSLVANGFNTCVLLSTGAVKCWGNNYFGQLGNGTTTDSSVPVEVAGINDAVALSSAGTSTCALLSSGNTRCWGKNDYGQFCNGTGASSSFPVNAFNGLNNIKLLSPGNYHSCAMLSDGTMKCCGYNYYGQLGNGTNVSTLLPEAVPGITDAVFASTGGYHQTCAVLSTGALKCWGYNNDGQMGNGTTVASNVPVDVIGITNGLNVSSGFYHVCAMLQGTNIKCWGNNGYGQLGNGTTVNSSVPVDVVGF